MRSAIAGLAVFLVTTWVVPSPAQAESAPVPLTELAKPGRILMLRHAHAPGVGDPPQFALAQCSTQRNLDAAGREQARRLGSRIRAAGVEKARLYSSQWCRALETAHLLQLGPVEPLPALNSFYGRPHEREQTLDALRAFLARLPADGSPVVLVTHQVVVNAFTEVAPSSGSGSIFQLNGTGAPKWVGAISSE